MPLLETIASSTLFQSLEQPQLQRIAALAGEESYPADKVIFREGESLRNLYVVGDGSVTLTTEIRLWANERTLRSIIAIVEAGGTLGWSALVEPYRATLSAHTTGQCRLVAINGQELLRLMDEDAHMGYQVMKRLALLVAHRLRAAQMSIMSERANDLLYRPLAI